MLYDELVAQMKAVGQQYLHVSAVLAGLRGLLDLLDLRIGNHTDGDIAVHVDVLNAWREMLASALAGWKVE